MMARWPVRYHPLGEMSEQMLKSFYSQHKTEGVLLSVAHEYLHAEWPETRRGHVGPQREEAVRFLRRVAYHVLQHEAYAPGVPWCFPDQLWEVG